MRGRGHSGRASARDHRPDTSARDNRPDTSARGQVFTLEAVLAAVILLSSVLIALQVAGVTSQTPSTANQQVGNQLGGVADGVLVAARENGSLKPAVLYWDDSVEPNEPMEEMAENETIGAFHGTAVLDGGEENFYVSTSPPEALTFGELLANALGDRDLAYNVEIAYLTEDGDIERQTMVSHGTPSDDAVGATATVPLYDSDVLYDADEQPTNRTLAETAANESRAFYAPDAASEGPVYNVVRVEVVVWRT